MRACDDSHAFGVRVEAKIAEETSDVFGGLHVAHIQPGRTVSLMNPVLIKESMVMRKKSTTGRRLKERNDLCIRYPEGIASSSLGLRGTSYPRNTGQNRVPTSRGLRPTRHHRGHDPVGVDAHLTLISQGSSFLATLGWLLESLWDSRTDQGKTACLALSCNYSIGNRRERRKQSLSREIPALAMRVAKSLLSERFPSWERTVLTCVQASLLSVGSCSNELLRLSNPQIPFSSSWLSSLPFARQTTISRQNKLFAGEMRVVGDRLGDAAAFHAFEGDAVCQTEVAQPRLPTPLDTAGVECFIRKLDPA